VGKDPSVRELCVWTGGHRSQALGSLPKTEDPDKLLGAKLQALSGNVAPMFFI